MTYFVGISGAIASGKSVLANEIRRRLAVWDVKAEVVPFAHGLKYLASLEHHEDAYNLARVYFQSLGYPHVDRYVADLFTAFSLYPSKAGQKNRRLLQYIGTELGREKIHQDIWINALRLSVEQLPYPPDVVLVDDLRFVNESYFVDLHITIDTTSSNRNRVLYQQHLSNFPKDYVQNNHASEQEYKYLRTPDYILDIEPSPVAVGNVLLGIFNLGIFK
jgi:hypothetical protein